MTIWRGLTPVQQRALAKLGKEPSCAHWLRCRVSTLKALERMKLIHVETTCDAPRKAMATITDAGRAILNGEEQSR